MKKFAFLLCLLSATLFSQNETAKWYFGIGAGLDFMTSPPTVLLNSAITTTNNNEGCASISDGSGNLLFYTDGATIWNKLHVIMANGSGLLGNGPSGCTQAALIIKKPASNTLYYVFTLDDQFGPNGLQYSIVDISLASGNGSVTVKNVLLHTPSSERLCGARHCNGNDFWIISHDWNSNNFRAYLLTSAGINTTAVISPVGTVLSGPNLFIGSVKVSPKGKKLAMAISSKQVYNYELFDFDNSTGIVSNPLSLPIAGNPGGFGYGCEFSPDGTKLYGSSGFGTLYQWDLCLGSDSAILNFVYTFTCMYPSTMQLAPNGKIYVSRRSQDSLGTINSPNSPGATCNFVEYSQSVGTALCYFGLPNFVPGFYKTPSKFNFYYDSTGTCLTGSFNATNAGSCSYISQPVLSYSWNFGDPSSGSANTSTIGTPTHVYPSPGSYSVQLIINFNCSSDTVKQVVNIGNYAPPLSISGNVSLCTGESTTLTASGANSYSWSNNVSGPTITLTPTATTVYTVTGTGTTICTAVKSITVSVASCVGIESNDAMDASLSIYPNPTLQKITIENTKTTQVTIYNELGELIFEDHFDPGKNNIDISDLSIGIYFIRCADNLNTKTYRILKTD